MKYKVAVTTRITDTKEYHEIRDALSHDTVTYFRFQDALPIIIPNNIEIAEEYLSEVDLLFLSGGNSVSKSPDMSKNEFELSSIRDSIEEKLVRKAIEKEIPIIGVCRGMQFLNYSFGGTLESLVSPHIHSSGDHYLDFIKDCILSKKGEQIKVNSFHNYAIDKLGKNLECLAKSEDGFVEAFKHLSLPIYGIMWHPERLKKGMQSELGGRKFFEGIIENK